MRVHWRRIIYTAQWENTIYRPFNHMGNKVHLLVAEATHIERKSSSTLNRSASAKMNVITHIHRL